MYRFLVLLFVFVLSVNSIVSQTFELTLPHDSLEREYVLHIPQTYQSNTATPLVLALHGLTNSGNILMESSRFNEVADTANFIVCYPTAIENGVLGETAWNNGLIVGSSANDTDFLFNLIDEIAKDYSIDYNRIYVTGFSMGGFMSNRMACEFTDKIAAIAAHSGTIANNILDNCQPNRPMPVMHLHGTSDIIVPYGGNWVAGIESVDTLMRFWRDFNQCSNTYSVTELDNTFDDNITVEKRIFKDCNNDIELWLYSANNHGHSWLQPENDVFASKEIWNFFKQYSLNESPTYSKNIANNFDVSIFPNPAINEIELDFSSELANSSFEIFDLYGRCVLQQSFLSNKVNIAHLSSNIYMLVITNTKFRKTIKLMIK